jgi:hypothetical protein
MTFANYLKGQLNDFVDSYRQYFLRTLLIVLTLTVFCFVAIVLLLEFSDFEHDADKVHISLLSYFFSRYSAKDIYSLVDLSKTVFVFCVALFSIGFSRMKATGIDEKNEISFGLFIRKLRFQDILTLLGILVLCSILDYYLFRLHSFSIISISNSELQWWVRSLLFQLRIYIPLILFSFTIIALLDNKLPVVTLKKVLFLFVSLWIFNEFAYEISLFVRAHIFSLILTPTGAENRYLFESALGLILIAFYFLGYYSAMTTSLKLLEEN